MGISFLMGNVKKTPLKVNIYIKNEKNPNRISDESEILFGFFSVLVKDDFS
jgi:hypothetical protein